MRLIDADELKDIISQEVTEKFVRWDKTITVCEWETFIRDIIDNAPTVELPQVVLFAETITEEEKQKLVAEFKAVMDNAKITVGSERPQGEWKGNGIERICSECGFDVPVSKYILCKYCPNCGAKMRTETD